VVSDVCATTELGTYNEKNGNSNNSTILMTSNIEYSSAKLDVIFNSNIILLIQKGGFKLKYTLFKDGVHTILQFH
jgi:hypothetical protein